MIKSETDRLIKDPSTSYWLRDALVAASKRDIVDAINDADILSLVGHRVREADRFIKDPSTSYWLRNALVAARTRDTVAAKRDAKILLEALTNNISGNSMQLNDKKLQAFIIDDPRMIKVICPACHYSVRMTRKWIDDPEYGPPKCPVHDMWMQVALSDDTTAFDRF